MTLYGRDNIISSKLSSKTSLDVLSWGWSNAIVLYFIGGLAVNLNEIVESQRKYYNQGETLDVSFRIAMLKKLKNSILAYEENLYDALWQDLRKSKFESYETEIGLVIDEIDLSIKKLRSWAKPKRKRTPMVHFLSYSYRYPNPYGVVLIMSPWNYPFQLTMSPLVGAIAAGNCAVIKPSKYSKATSEIMEKIIEDTFKVNYVSVVETEGGRESIQNILKERYDYIFFTGGTTVGKVVMESASKNLTPVTLELGGKSPCIVDSDANIDLAAKRIVWGKFLNCGQTCVAPDYLWVQKDVKYKLLDRMGYYITEFYGENPNISPDYPRIINDRQFDRLISYLKKGNVVIGGVYDKETRYISPTIIDNVEWDYEIMKDEIFGPIMPVLEFSTIEEVIDKLRGKEKPLAFYYFTKSKDKEKNMMIKTTSGGGCINDTIIHVASHHVPFGGVGASGMGAYHGKASFDTFTHYKSIIKKSNLLDIRFRYAPYAGKLKWLKKIMG